MPVLTNITKFSIFDLSGNEYFINNVKMVNFEPSNPWLHIPIPYGGMQHQQINPKITTLKATCLNPISLYASLIDSGAYNSTTGLYGYFKYVVVTGQQSDGSTVTIQFGISTTHVETVSENKFTELVGESEWILQIHADGLPIPVESA